jgi:hypothetical protein
VDPAARLGKDLEELLVPFMHVRSQVDCSWLVMPLIVRR